MMDMMIVLVAGLMAVTVLATALLSKRENEIENLNVQIDVLKSTTATSVREKDLIGVNGLLEDMCKEISVNYNRAVSDNEHLRAELSDLYNLVDDMQEAWAQDFGKEYDDGNN